MTYYFSLIIREYTWDIHDVNNARNFSTLKKKSLRTCAQHVRKNLYRPPVNLFATSILKLKLQAFAATVTILSVMIAGWISLIQQQKRLLPFAGTVLKMPLHLNIIVHGKINPFSFIEDFG